MNVHVISRNLVVYNHSLCNYVRLNVTYNYEWLAMWLFFKFGWILVFLSTSCNYNLFHHFNTLFFHNVFVFFTTLYICLIAHATKVITLLLHKVRMLFGSYMYRLFNNTYILICIYVPIKYLPTFILFIKYLHTYTPTYPLTT
jgi:hypothetical protein